MNNAMTVIDQARKEGALVYVPQNLETPDLYKLESCVIQVLPKDFHDKEVNGRRLPRKELVDRIGDAAGISFIPQPNEFSIQQMAAEPALDLPARSVFVGSAQGKVRLSDGSWRTSTVEVYAFDYVAKATAEEPSNPANRKRKMIEYYKAGAQRAATGARLRVIKQLTGIPSGFTEEELKACQGKLVFSRIVQNTDYVLSTPEGKMMAIAMATGAAQMMYGKQLGAPEPVAQPEGDDIGTVSFRHAEDQQTVPAGSGFDSDDPELGGKPSTEPTKQELSEALFHSLEQWLLSDEITKRMKTEIELAVHKKESDPKVLQDLLDKVIKNQKDLAEYKRSGKVPA